MSVQLLGTAGYFSRLGAWIGEFNRVSALYGTALTNTAFQSIWTQYATSDQAAVVGLPAAQASYINSPNSYQNYLANAAQTSSQLQVNDNFPLNPYTFTQSVLNIASQMTSTSQTVNKPTITSTVASGTSNVGNPTFATYTLNPYGVQSDTIYAETVTITCNNNSSAYNESFQAVGTVAVPFTAYNWPQGSGCTQNITLTNPANTTLVTDGMFVSWTGTGNNTPVYWSILNGTAGTQVLQGTSPIRSGYSYSASIVSDGSSATQLYQSISGLQPNTVYAFAVQAKISAVGNGGIFRIALTNSSNTVLTNSAGNNLLQTFTTSSATPSSTNVGTSYANFIVFFATGQYIPSTVYLQIGFSTAPTSGTLSLDLAAGTTATQLYNQGPFIVGFSGSTASSLNDVFTATYTNSLGTQSFVRGLQRVCNSSNLGPKVYFPSSNSPTISDSLITNP